ncbi:hypothetical protein BFU36_06965 [Sulfolobus sp. A20]|uniref:hypothetical protein n=1 Tax=Sulfolobaceae TaxID=118883 RepID=UPI000845E497|nr:MULTISPECIES: hypothetical protein [unclassified Sulfolobus]TRM74453.1 hypothetical protein DJ523_04880 [Sulfolobus sp. E5]TRM75845.1 hypothetical protein DJ532_09150 [Sulfolobus sp. A20-N-F8]TRM79006.1 hypothetical protein DJ528_03220 [Sulfolobus sp. B5]TRM83594.1 hypothetical protein DJ531_04960 [Sulfolobus sp. A20-N-F6]TRM84915.1 hypothetical protein DJ522_02810 [Sulfolobus sp. F3]TRM88323.1 hypothetical protein DJ529_05610 [Sulfolobus sp. C3]TRM95295.1 hypothetical protein DJ526_00650
MDFLSKKERIVLIAIAQAGPAGIPSSSLSALSYVMTKDTIQRIIEDLYFKGYINVIRDVDEIRYIASKNVRNAMVNFEFHKYKLLKNLEKLKKDVEEISKLDKQQQIGAFKNLIRDLMSQISTSLITLFNDLPDLTIPEYIELLENLDKEFLSRLLPIIQENMSEEELATFISLISRFRGEKEAEQLKTLLQRAKENVNNK